MHRTNGKKNYTPRVGKAESQAACLDAIFKAVDAEGLSDEVMKRLHKEINAVSQHFGIGAYAAVLLAAILEKSYSSHCLDDEDMAKYFGCSNIEFIEHHSDLRQMVRGGVIQEFKNNRRCYRITPEAVKSIEKATAFTPVKMMDLTPGEFFERMREPFKRFRSNDIDPDDLLCELESLIQNNSQLDFC